MLRARRDRFAEGRELVDAAETAYREARDRRRLAEVCAVRGYVLNESRQADRRSVSVTVLATGRAVSAVRD